ncbi:MAG: Ig-like domain-containing protein [Weeksellaceae bacterium]
MKIKNFTYILVIFLLISSCARKGRPSGGPQDLMPPILLKATPDTFQTNVSTKIREINLNFDEYIVLKDFNQNFLISPPIDPAPMVTPVGMPTKNIKIALNGTLQENTTYALNFGQSIEDNNEGNKLPYFSYVFSTGDYIDSLTLDGKVNFPLSKKAPENIIAALYRIDSAYTDSIIYKNKPYYLAKTDSASHFSLKNLKAGEYRLVAFNDENPNLQFDPRQEHFAFYPEIVNPATNKSYDLTLYKPAQTFRFIEAKQLEQGKIGFYFQGNPEKIDIKSISHDIASAKVIHKPYSDTLLYYFNPKANGDTLMEKRPRLQFSYTHQGITDTIPNIMYDKLKVTPLKVYAKSMNYTPGKMYEIEANYPLDTLNKNYIQVREDSVDLDFKIKRITPFTFGLDFPLHFDKKYAVALYPKAAIDIMGRSNDTLQLNFNIQDEREFGNLKLKIQNKPAFPTWLNLYSSNDKELESIYSEKSQFNFKYLKPGTYYFKLYVDENSNEKYDTGDFMLQRQPEPIYIYPEPIEVKAFWDIEENWILGEESTSDSEIPATPNSEEISKDRIPEDVLNSNPLEKEN